MNAEEDRTDAFVLVLTWHMVLKDTEWVHESKTTCTETQKSFHYGAFGDSTDPNRIAGHMYDTRICTYVLILYGDSKNIN